LRAHLGRNCLVHARYGGDAGDKMDSLQAELAVSPPASTREGRSSPPLAFAPTSNDSLAPLISPSSLASQRRDRNSFSSPSPQHSAIMGLQSPQEQDLQVIVDQQSSAIQLLHEAFAAERQVWSLEKDRLYQRIASLEQLLKNRDHYRYGQTLPHAPTPVVVLTATQSRQVARHVAL
jgi:hypothetical protein